MDSSTTRKCALMKRLLQIALHDGPAFATASLILVSHMVHGKSDNNKNSMFQFIHLFSFSVYLLKFLLLEQTPLSIRKRDAKVNSNADVNLLRLSKAAVVCC